MQIAALDAKTYNLHCGAAVYPHRKNEGVTQNSHAKTLAAKSGAGQANLEANASQTERTSSGPTVMRIKHAKRLGQVRRVKRSLRSIVSAAHARGPSNARETKRTPSGLRVAVTLHNGSHAVQFMRCESGHPCGPSTPSGQAKCSRHSSGPRQSRSETYAPNTPNILENSPPTPPKSMPKPPKIEPKTFQNRGLEAVRLKSVFERKNLRSWEASRGVLGASWGRLGRVLGPSWSRLAALCPLPFW